MTVIAAMRDAERGVTWIGSDSMAVDNCTCLYGIQKWIVRKPWAVGIAGDLRTINVIQAAADDLLGGLPGAFYFTQRFRSLLDDQKYNVDAEEGGAPGYGQQAILAHPGGVWAIGPNFSIVEAPDGELWADGTGRAYALGASHAMTGKPKAKVRAAVNAAIRYCNNCGGEPFLEKLGS